MIIQRVRRAPKDKRLEQRGRVMKGEERERVSEEFTEGDVNVNPKQISTLKWL